MYDVQQKLIIIPNGINLKIKLNQQLICNKAILSICLTIFLKLYYYSFQTDHLTLALAEIQQMHFNPSIPSNYSNYAPQNGIMRSGQVLISNRGLQHINCILPSQGNKGALFLGDVVCTLKQQLLQKHQIKSILSCMTQPSTILFINKVSSSSIQNIITSHKILPIHDTLQFPIEQFFKQSRQFIHLSRQKGHNVLVHCHAGVSRSAAIVCAYIMEENMWSFQQAIEFVREKRYRAKPNASFVKQLILYYQNQLAVRSPKKLMADNNAGTRISDSISMSNVQAKAIIIKLDQEIQTHDELKLLQETRANKKNNLLTHRNQDRIQVSHPSKEIPSSRLTKPKHALIFPNQKLTHENKSQIHFNKVYDPNLKKSQLDIKNNKSFTNLGEIKTVEKKSVTFFSGRREQREEPLMVKSMLNNKNVSNDLSFINISTFRTPIKTKPSSVKVNHLSVGSNNGPSEFVLVQTIKTPPTNHPQIMVKNQNRYSLTGNYTSYKQYY